MALVSFLKKIMNSIFFNNTQDNEHFIKYLKSNGAIIGEGTRFIDPKRCSIDPGRLDYIEIGKNCCLSVVSIIAHDYSWYIMANSHSEILPDAGGDVIIGDNCFIGYQACILKGTKIGNNVIIGAKSVVKGNIPSNTVWAGIPAKQVCGLDEYFQKKFNNKIKEAISRREHIRKKKDRDPNIYEMGFFAFVFLERTQDNYDKYLKELEFNGIKNCSIVKELFFKTTPEFNSFEAFLKA